MFTTSGSAAKRPTMVILATRADAVLENVRVRGEVRGATQLDNRNDRDIAGNQIR